MASLTRMRKAWRPVLVGAMVLAGLTTAATPASAASTNRTGLCNKATYSATLQFPARGGLSSTLVPPNGCWSIELPSGSTENVYVYGYTSGGVEFFMGWKTINSGEHNVFRTYGSSSSPSFTFVHN
ncbi:hypothetical protein ACWDV4_17105 [Micromonospora sp. NPDC003197]